MRYVEVAGVKLSAIGVGCWQFGSREWGYGRDYVEREAGQIVRRALDLGVNLLDTAEVYGFGTSERTVGKAIVGRRDEAFVATKLLPVLPLAPVVVQRGRASARRLGIDTIDLYQLHWPNPVVPLSTTMDGIRRLQDENVIRNAGVSNYSLRLWKEAERVLGRPVISNQVRYSLVDRRPEQELTSYAAQNDRIVIAYSPLGQGLLAAKYDADNAPGGVRATNPLFLPENLERASELIGALRDVAKNYDATPAQVALAWVIRRKNVVAIPGASSVSQLESNVAAADIELTDDDDARLTEASDRFRPVRGPAVVPKLLRARLGR